MVKVAGLPQISVLLTPERIVAYAENGRDGGLAPTRFAISSEVAKQSTPRETPISTSRPQKRPAACKPK
jgi:hypothetical protein